MRMRRWKIREGRRTRFNKLQSASVRDSKMDEGALLYMRSDRDRGQTGLFCHTCRGSVLKGTFGLLVGVLDTVLIVPQAGCPEDSALVPCLWKTPATILDSQPLPGKKHLALSRGWQRLPALNSFL